MEGVIALLTDILVALTAVGVAIILYVSRRAWRKGTVYRRR